MDFKTSDIIGIISGSDKIERLVAPICTTYHIYKGDDFIVIDLFNAASRHKVQYWERGDHVEGAGYTHTRSVDDKTGYISNRSRSALDKKLRELSDTETFHRSVR